jgi:hypothetical protein
LVPADASGTFRDGQAAEVGLDMIQVMERALLADTQSSANNRQLTHSYSQA